MAKKRITKKELALLDRLEHLVLRDHGHEWMRMDLEGTPRSLYFCMHCRRGKNDYLHGSRTATASGEVACVYSQT